jgi:Right handed beta helix region
MSNLIINTASIISREASVIPVGVTPPTDAIDLVYTESNISGLRLRAVPTVSGHSVKVLGYWTAGDCSMPIYIWDAASLATDNGGTIIKSSAVNAASPGRWIIKETESLSVRWFGAKGDNTANDTAAFTACILAARNLSVATIVPAGVYRIGSLPSLVESVPPHRETSLLGEPTGGSVIKSLCTGTSPCILIEANSGGTVNLIVEHLSISPATNYQGTAIKINATNKAIVRNCKIEKNNYGVWLTSDTPNLWCELNSIKDCWIDRNNNGIRIEWLTGTFSFHGSTFKDCWGAVQPGQTFLNHVSGFYYNGQFDLHIWCESMTSAAVNCNGSAVLNKGTIQVENYEDNGAVITGNGRFWYIGDLLSLGVVTDQTDQTKNEPVFSCSNWSSDHGKAFGSGSALDLGLTIDASVNGPLAKDNGSFPGLFGVKGTNIISPALIGYSFAGNGLFYFNAGFQASLESANLRWKLSEDANLVGYGIGPKILRHNAPYKALETRDDGRLKSDCGQTFEGNITPGQTYFLMESDYGQDPSLFLHFSVRIWGVQYEFRALYVINHQGFGGPGVVTKISDGFVYPNAAVTNVVISMDQNARPVITLDTTIALQYKCYLEGVGKK